MLKKISLIPNAKKDPRLLRTAKVLEALGDFQGELFLPEEFRTVGEGALRRPVTYVPEEELFTRGEILITLGGDGTILSVAARAATAEIPVFGINLGTVGFLTALEEKDLKELPRLIQGDYVISPRMMLSCRVGEGEELLALNEFVIAPRQGFHIVELSLFTEKRALCDFRADGLIFNTPTGSTGYSFSAGGAVMASDFDAIGVKAVSSYLLINAHHMIFPPDEHFTVKHCRSEGGLVTVCADGREEKTIDLGDEVHIAKANKNLNLIFLKENSNLEVFFRKF